MSENLSNRPSDTEIKSAIKEHYSQALTNKGSGCCGPKASCCGPASAVAGRPDLIELSHYSAGELESLPADAVQNSFGCGNPLAFTGVQPGQVVLDIGSGAGIDVLLASRIVGPSGKVIGLDMTPEMIERARGNAAEAGAANAEFRLGEAEEMPVEGGSVDWIISNCVINLAPDKRKVFSEAFRALKPGGQVSISDIVTGRLPDEIRRSLALWASCVSGAISEEEYLGIMREVGFVDVDVTDRQTYDENTIRDLLADGTLDALDPALLQKLVERKDEIVPNIWSARIVARKPE